MESKPVNGNKSTRKRKYKWKVPPWTPICHHTKEAYTVYKWYKTFQSFYKKRGKKEIILMAYPIYKPDWTIKRYQRMYVELKDLLPFFRDYLDSIDISIHEKEEV